MDAGRHRHDQPAGPPTVELIIGESHSDGLLIGEDAVLSVQEVSEMKRKVVHGSPVVDAMRGRCC